MRNLSPNARPPRGFTLLELGVVLAVSAILAAAVVPDFIEASRTKMAERVAEHVLAIHQASRAYFVKTASMPGTPPNTWPGQSSSGAGQPVNVFCRMALNPATGLANDPYSNLVGQGLLPGRPVHPFNREYSLSLRPSPLLGNSTGCLLQVTTELPEQLAQSFLDTVPQSGCSTGNTPNFCDVTGPVYPALPAPTPGYVRCCSFVPKPGVGVISGCASPRALAFNPNGNVLTCN